MFVIYFLKFHLFIIIKCCDKFINKIIYISFYALFSIYFPTKITFYFQIKKTFLSSSKASNNITQKQKQKVHAVPLRFR